MPTDPADFEKHNLCAHVQLCSERLTALNIRIDSVDQSIVDHNDRNKEVYGLIKERYTDLSNATNLRIDNLTQTIANQDKLIKTLQMVLDRNEARMITWGVGIIATLASGLAYIITKHIIL